MPYTNEDFIQVIGSISILFSTWDLFSTILAIRLAKRVTPLPNLDRKTLPQKLHLLKRLAASDVVNPEVLNRVHLALPEALAVAEERNRFIHDQWVFSPESVPLGEISLLSIQVVMGAEGRTVAMPVRMFRIEDLNAFLSAVGAQQKEFAALVSELPLSN